MALTQYPFISCKLLFELCDRMSVGFLQGLIKIQEKENTCLSTSENEAHLLLSFLFFPFLKKDIEVVEEENCSIARHRR